MAAQFVDRAGLAVVGGEYDRLLLRWAGGSEYHTDATVRMRSPANRPTRLRGPG